MARKALKVKQARRLTMYLKDLAAGRKPKNRTKIYQRCTLCGRVGGYMKRFGLCRICFREHALRGQLAGVKKCSW